MTYEIFIGYNCGTSTERLVFRGVAEIIHDEKAYILLNEKMQIIFTAPYDSVIYVAQIPSPPNT